MLEATHQAAGPKDRGGSLVFITPFMHFVHMCLCSSVGGSARGGRLNCAVCLYMKLMWSVLQPTCSYLCLRCDVHNFSHRFVVPDTPMISELFCQRGSTSRFQWCASHSFSPSLHTFLSLHPSFTLAPHFGLDPDTTVEIISDKRIRTICIQPIKKKEGVLPSPHSFKFMRPRPDGCPHWPCQGCKHASVIRANSYWMTLH